MANNYFEFKQFTVWQDQCAMKVCTDSCLFGSLLPVHDSIQKVLDIGTGTGLLSLQYAQKNAAAQILALEIEPLAAQQAMENVAHSPFHHRIKIQQADFFDFSTVDKYDLIICNPPFYENDLAPLQTEKKLAHHNQDFSLQVLLEKASTMLATNGIISILLPYKRKEEVKSIAKTLGLHIAKEYRIKQTPKHDYFRVIYYFAKEETIVEQETIIIKDCANYTDAFTVLLKPFYLHL